MRWFAELMRDFDYKRIFAALNAFMTVDLSAFYFDIRKDALYCDPYSSVKRKACLTVLDHLFRCTVTWLAPMLCFTAEEAWLARDPKAASVHLEAFPAVPASWRDDALAEKWRKLRNLRRVVTGALELERAGKRIGSSLEAAPIVYVADPRAVRHRGRRRSCRIVHHLGRHPGRRRGAGRRRSGSTTWPGVAVEPRLRRRPQMRPLVEDFARRRQRSAISRRDAARRSSAARMGRHAQGGGVGGRDGGGGASACAALLCLGAVERAGSWRRRGSPAASTRRRSFGCYTCSISRAAAGWRSRHLSISCVTWNTGISYGLFQQKGLARAWALLAFKAAAVVFLWIWLARASSRLTAVALGLIIGGAVGNAIDRLHWPGVMDFVLFHVQTASWSFHWYVFNLADVAIVAGVVGLLYDSLRVGTPQKRPDPG